VAFFALHPRIDDPSDRQQFFQAIADSGVWDLIQLIRLAGLLA